MKVLQRFADPQHSSNRISPDEIAVETGSTAVEVTAGLDALITGDGNLSSTVFGLDGTVAQRGWRSKFIACETS